MGHSPWVDLPGMYDGHALATLSHALSDAGVEHETRTIMTGADVEGGGHAHLVRVFVDHVRAAARVLGVYFELEDPEQALPHSGVCPACGHDVEAAWACPSCELSFRPHVNPRDPLVAFLREHGGFLRPPEPEQEAEGG